MLEVLAAIFVVSIGLLGVLAVIPFGAFQVSKAQHAEYASNMLANAIVEIRIREMAKPTEWNIDVHDPWGDCTSFIWIEPRMSKPNLPAHQHIFRIDEANHDLTDKWEELMRGQDDLVYSTYDDRRPDFSGQGGKIQSSGKYTWFFTFMPETEATYGVSVDVLACYNRVPGDDQQVQPDGFMHSLNGGTFTLDGNAELLELLSQTKYVLVTWERTVPNIVDGVWCRIIFVDRSHPEAPKIVVMGALPDLNTFNSGLENNNTHIYIPSGVLYHKRVANVPIE